MATKDVSTLTDRQRDVFELVRPVDDGGKGMTTRQAGEQLGITYNATNEHVRNLRKLGFLPKGDQRRRNAGSSNGRSAASAPKMVTGSNGRFGRVASKLQEAEAEADAIRAEINAEMEELSKRQHDLAAEAEGVETLRTDIHQRVEALA